MATSVPKPPKGHFNILYFASAQSYTSKEYEALPAPLPLSQLFPMLEDRYGGITMKVLESCLVTVNLDYVDVPTTADTGSDTMVIQEGDEVALIPPVSSG